MKKCEVFSKAKLRTKEIKQNNSKENVTYKIVLTFEYTYNAYKKFLGIPLKRSYRNIIKNYSYFLYDDATDFDKVNKMYINIIDGKVIGDKIFLIIQYKGYKFDCQAYIDKKSNEIMSFINVCLESNGEVYDYSTNNLINAYMYYDKLSDIFDELIVRQKEQKETIIVSENIEN